MATQRPFNFILRCLPLLAFEITNCAYHELPGPHSCDDNPVLLELEMSQNVSSCLQNDGIVIVKAKSGSGPYSYSIDGATFQSSGVFDQLSSGVYIFSATDATGCIDTMKTIVANFTSDLVAQVIVSPNSDCLNPNGTITVSADFGTPPYLYNVDGSDYTSQQVFAAIDDGQHAIRVMDSKSCTIEIAAVVPRESTGISWAQDVEPIITTRCAKPGCHVGQSGRANLSEYSSVFEFRSQIRRRVENESMPFDGSLPDDQKTKILCWIDDGSPNN